LLIRFLLRDSRARTDEKNRALYISDAPPTVMLKDSIIAHISLVCICDIPYVSYWLFDLATLDEGVDLRVLTGAELEFLN